MSNKINSEVTLLLTLSLGDDSNPLSDEEWDRLTSFLYKLNKTPADINANNDELLNQIELYVSLQKKRILHLLDRGNSLSLNLSEWARYGIWWITRSDTDYPLHLKKSLGKHRPPVIFGCGNKKDLCAEIYSLIISKKELKEDFKLSESQKTSIGWSQDSKIITIIPEKSEASIPDANIYLVINNLETALLQKEIRERIKKNELTLISFNSPKLSYSNRSKNQCIYLMNCLASVNVYFGATEKGSCNFRSTNIFFKDGTLVQINKAEKGLEQASEQQSNNSHIDQPSVPIQLSLFPGIEKLNKENTEDLFLEIMMILLKKVLSNQLLTFEEILAACSTNHVLRKDQLEKCVKIAIDKNYLLKTDEGRYGISNGN